MPARRQPRHIHTHRVLTRVHTPDVNADTILRPTTVDCACAESCDVRMRVTCCRVVYGRVWLCRDHSGLGEVSAVVVPLSREAIEVRLRVRDVAELAQRVFFCGPISASMLGQRGYIPVMAMAMVGATETSGCHDATPTLGR